MKIKNIRGDEYSGTIGKAVVHFMRNGVNVAREYVVPNDPRTTAQIAQRNYLKTAVAEWHRLSGAEKLEWNKCAKTKKYSSNGYNLFISKWLILRNRV